MKGSPIQDGDSGGLEVVNEDSRGLEGCTRSLIHQDVTIIPCEILQERKQLPSAELSCEGRLARNRRALNFSPSRSHFALGSARLVRSLQLHRSRFYYTTTMRQLKHHEAKLLKKVRSRLRRAAGSLR